MTSEQRPPVNNGHYFWALRMVVVRKFYFIAMKMLHKLLASLLVFFASTYPAIVLSLTWSFVFNWKVFLDQLIASLNEFNSEAHSLTNQRSLFLIFFLCCTLVLLAIVEMNDFCLRIVYTKVFFSQTSYDLRAPKIYVLFVFGVLK
jgi:hypothetical protein